MTNETLVPATEVAEPQTSSELSSEPIQPEIPAGENIADAIRNAIRKLGLGKTIGLTAFAVIVPFGLPVAVAAGTALIAKGKRS